VCCARRIKIDERTAEKEESRQTHREGKRGGAGVPLLGKKPYWTAELKKGIRKGWEEC